MNRRAFFGTMIGGVAAASAVRQWPFRVYSFPSKPVIAPGDLIVPYTPYFFEGQRIAIYGADGNLRSSEYYQIDRIDAVRRQVYVHHIERPEFLNLERHV